MGLIKLWNKKLLFESIASSYLPKFSILCSRKLSRNSNACALVKGTQGFFVLPGWSLNFILIILSRSGKYKDVLFFGFGGNEISLGSFFLLSASNDHFSPIGLLSLSTNIPSSFLII